MQIHFNIIKDYKVSEGYQMTQITLHEIPLNR